MATLTLSQSPSAAPLAAMSSRRGPLTVNNHAANSPLRGASALLKQKRSLATTQREESYGQQPPPYKKQVLDHGVSRPARSPSKLPRAQGLPQRAAQSQIPASVRLQIKERTTSKLAPTTQGQHGPDERHMDQWKKYYRCKFPKMVFYFDHIPDETRAKLTKRVGMLGARQEAFFSNDVTHVITTRPIPNEKSEIQPIVPRTGVAQPEPEPEEQPQTINPSLLDRNMAARRKLLSEFRNVPTRSQNLYDPTKPHRGVRNNDVLHKAMEMGKKIWPLDKFASIVTSLLESQSRDTTQAAGTTTARGPLGTAKTQEANLYQLLHNERVHGPSDRDLATSSREMVHFKGPFVYVHDMDEKVKPIIVREYQKVVNKSDGDWPQFRSVGNGRCPFVEEIDLTSKEERKPRDPEQSKGADKRQEGPTVLQPPAVPALQPVTGKRTLMEMEDGHNKGGRLRAAVLNPALEALSKQAFLSKGAQTGRIFQGEPVASGMQANNVTSAIRSQMISSASGISGVKAGTSKEIHGLQRQVLQKTAPGSHSAASSRLAEQQSAEGTSSRSLSMSRQTSKLAQTREESSQRVVVDVSKTSQTTALKSKKDLKPGYCENCQDKFRDFDEHILTRKHRKFAEDDKNWVELDALLSELSRLPKGAILDEDEWAY